MLLLVVVSSVSGPTVIAVSWGVSCRFAVWQFAVCSHHDHTTCWYLSTSSYVVGTYGHHTYVSRAGRAGQEQIIVTKSAMCREPTSLLFTTRCNLFVCDISVVTLLGEMRRLNGCEIHLRGVLFNAFHLPRFIPRGGDYQER